MSEHSCNEYCKSEYFHKLQKETRIDFSRHDYERGIRKERKRILEIIESKRLPLQPEIVQGVNYIVEHYNSVLDEIKEEIKKDERA